MQAISVAIGERKLIGAVRGAGPVTVILETGLGAEADDWERVGEGLCQYFRVLTYDRANRGRSDPAPGPRDAFSMLNDLDALLLAHELAGPFILVGHSFGGLLMRMFAARHPGEVRGLVLVDALHWDQFEVFGRLFPPAFEGEPQELSGLRAFWTGGWRDFRSTTEQIDMPACLLQDSAVKSLGDLPVEILTAGGSFLRNPQVPEPIRPVLQARWEELQGRFRQLSTNAVWTMVDEAGHFIQRDSPDSIVVAVGRIAVAAGGPR